MSHAEQPLNGRPDRAALLVLGILQGLMLAALYTRTPPHPPFEIALFALGPFLSAAIALCAAALALGGTDTRAGRVTSMIAALASVVSFGPHKWFAESFVQIWPAVVLAQAACALLLFITIKSIRQERSAWHHGEEAQ